MLRRNFWAALPATEFGSDSYFDDLPFEWSALNAHRKPICEYCFFGGPDKTVARPQHDWF